MRRELVIVVVELSSACVGHGAASTPRALSASESTAPVVACGTAAGPATSSVITAAELRRAGSSNLYDVVRRLRPGFFTTRGRTSINNEPAAAIVVIMNRQVIGGVDELRSMGTSDLFCVRRLLAAEVYLVTGTSPPAGGIELIRRW